MNTPATSNIRISNLNYTKIPVDQIKNYVGKPITFNVTNVGSVDKICTDVFKLNALGG